MKLDCKSSMLLLLVMGCAGLSGCTDEPEQTPVAAVSQPQSAQPLPPVATVLPPPPTVPPPGAAQTPGQPVATLPEAIANDGSLASYVTPHASAYFQDKDGEFVAASAQDVVERAIVAYREIQGTKHDDSPDWPVFNDLSLLVKYKILRALPPGPNGQRFTYDAATKKVSLAAN